MKFNCLVAVAAIASSIGGCVVYPTATVRVSPNYTATGSLPGVRADVYGHRTLLEFADEPSFLTVIDTFGNEVPYEREGRYFRLAKKLDHFAVKTGLHTVHFNIIDRVGAQSVSRIGSDNGFDPQAFPGQSLQYAPVVPPSNNKLNSQSSLFTTQNPFPAAQANPAPASLPLMASTSVPVAPFTAQPGHSAPKHPSDTTSPKVIPPSQAQSATPADRPTEKGMKPPSQPILPLPSQPKLATPIPKAVTPPPIAETVSAATAVSLPSKPATAVVAPASVKLPTRSAIALAAPQPQKIVWEAKPGMTLQGVVQQWSVKAGWTMDWKAADLDYPIDYPLSFEGSYEMAIKNLFDLYSDAKRSFIVNGSTTLKTLNVCEFNNRMGNNKCI